MTDEFWLTEILAQELTSATMAMAAMADYYSWRTHRDARWCRVLSRWGGKHTDGLCQRCKLCVPRRDGSCYVCDGPVDR